MDDLHGGRQGRPRHRGVRGPDEDEGDAHESEHVRDERRLPPKDSRLRRVVRSELIALQAYIETSAAPGGTRLSVRIEETWSGYVDAKSRGKYDALFALWIQALRVALPALSEEPGDQGQDIAGELARPAELHAQGLITQEEFTSAKASVLARPDTAGSSPQRPAAE